MNSSSLTSLILSGEIWRYFRTNVAHAVYYINCCIFVHAVPIIHLKTMETEDLCLEKAINSVHPGDFQSLLPVSSRPSTGQQEMFYKPCYSIYTKNIYMIKTTYISTAQLLNII
jgi:hypothetical protein